MYEMNVPRDALVKLKLVISIAAVCLGSNTVPVTVIIVVKYRLVYLLIIDRRQ